MPTNCKMADLKRAFEAAGFTDVKTILGSGNVVFGAKAAADSDLEKKAEVAMKKTLGREFFTVVRPIDELEKLLAGDPYAKHHVKAGSKRIVTFLRAPVKPKVALPLERDNARILALEADRLYSSYLPTAKGPVFMALIEKAVGKEQTTRTWQTIERIVKAG
jgi:uncharacterized protein (DUF1697 family)